MDQKPQQKPVGYDDTPFIPGTQWRVHDSKRPQPRAIVPGTASTLEKAGQPPSDATVLFDGTDLSKWTGRDGAAKWKVENGYMEVTRTGDIETREQFGDCQLHIEWATPTAVAGDSQGRGNSGVFLMGKYEIQVLDCYQNPTYADGTASAIYGQYPPLVNASRKPGEWQAYDIVFIAPRYDGQKLVSPAFITVFHNGVLVHYNRKAMGPTGHKTVSSYDTPHGPKGPIKLQDHGNPVHYRNIWVRSIDGYDRV